MLTGNPDVATIVPCLMFAGPIQAMLDNMSTRLIADMDEGGIDIAVLSENNPAAHNLDPEISVAMAKALTGASLIPPRAGEGEAVVSL